MDNTLRLCSMPVETRCKPLACSFDRKQGGWGGSMFASIHTFDAEPMTFGDAPTSLALLPAIARQNPPRTRHRNGLVGHSVLVCLAGESKNKVWPIFRPWMRGSNTSSSNTLATHWSSNKSGSEWKRRPAFSHRPENSRMVWRGSSEN